VYNDAANTYTITVPAGRTDEEIQDVVAAMILAGANVTKTYDDAGNTLTITASAASSPGGSVYLSVPSPYVPRSPTPSSTLTFNDSVIGQYVAFTPTADFSLKGLRDTYLVTGTPVKVQIWASATSTLLAETASATKIANVPLEVSFTTPVTLTAGVTYRIGWRRTGGTNQLPGTTGASFTWAGFPAVTQFYYNSATEAYPTSSFSGYAPTFDLIKAGNTKGVIGPLDPLDFPRLTASSDAVASSGYMLVNDAAKTASLYWKFSDGTTKKIDLA
jgi:hypothetical protein